jgi:hypothetical protein
MTGRCQEAVQGLGRGAHPSANQGVRVVPGHSLCPKVGALSEGMWVAATCLSEMVEQLATLQAAVSSAAQSMLERPPNEAFLADVVGEMLAMF